MKTRIKIALPLLVVLILAACSSWDHTTYQTLAASKAVIDQAAADYNAGTLPKTAAVKAVIEKAQGAQRAAVTAFEAYAVAKTAGDPSATVEQKKQAVIQAVALVAQVVAEIKALKQ